MGFFTMMATLIFLENGLIPPRFFIIMMISLVVFYLNYSLLVPFLLLRKRTLLYILSVLLLVCSPLIVIYFYPYPQPLDIPSSEELDSFIRRVEGLGRFKYMFPVLFNLVFLVMGTTIRVYEQLIRNDRKKQLIESEKTTTELQFLKNQINPHFLFNSLNSIYSLTIQKSNDAPEAVITLSELMRYMLYQTNDEFVLLKSEIDFIQNYMKLQRLRIVNNEHININVHGIVSNQKIRPLLLISFIENAFKYGSDFKGNTEISIKIYVKEDEIQFTCMNLIGNRNKDNKNSGIGLRNTKERLLLLYPEKHWLTVKEENNKFIIDLTLKLS
jgi:sensor histidine kinase YesM